MIFLNENGDIKNTNNTFTETPHIAVIDFERPKNPDFYWPKIDTFEEFHAPAVLVRLHDTLVTLPFRWSIMICDLDTVSPMSLEEVHGRGLQAFAVDPIGGYMMERINIRFETLYQDVSFRVPKLSKSQLLALPIGSSKKKNSTVCVLVGEVSKKIPDDVDMSALWC